ncbi:type II secretion system protein GspD [Campylobacter concisus]|uniref:type II secretion system protein GspD n=2 Tax=Campylobacter concisus TaxID=199 RepID=UPI00165FF7D0|nr:hypothetical protein [Campylobacter concisus]
MKNLQRLILVLCFLLSSSLSALEYRNITFNDFLGEISSITGKNIVISGNVDTNFDVFLPTLDLSNTDTFSKLLKDILNVNGLDYLIQDSVLLIYNPTVEEKPVLKDYIIKFKHISKEDVVSALSLFNENIKYTVYSDRVLLLTTESQYKIIDNLINGLDTSYQLRQLSFTIISTDNTKLKEIGPRIESILSPLDHFYFKIITNVLTVDSTKVNKDSVTSLINLLKEKGVSDLIYNPRVTVIDNKDSVIESVIKTPIQKSSIDIQNSQSITTNQVEYQDVGLKLYISSVLITNDSVSFTLDLYIENLLDDTLTPRISSRHLKTNVYLTDTNSFLIGGINSKETIKSTKTIPFIENIPILGDITTYKSEKTSDYSFSIFITMLPSEKDIFSEFYYDPADKHLALERYLTSASRNAKGAPRSGE